MFFRRTGPLAPHEDEDEGLDYLVTFPDSLMMSAQNQIRYSGPAVEFKSVLSSPDWKRARCRHPRPIGNTGD